MLKNILRFIIVCIVFTGLSGFRGRAQAQQDKVVQPDETLYQTGVKFLATQQYLRARMAFQTLIHSYPDSGLAAPASFSIGDTFYNEGSAAGLLQAEKQYETFIARFPAHPKVPDARLKIIDVNMKLMESPNYGREYAVKAEQRIREFLETYPGSDSVPMLKERLEKVEEFLAKDPELKIIDLNMRRMGPPDSGR
jgi:outer membrane assembly lipoprotein YfiO